MILQLFLQNPAAGILLMAAIILALGVHEAAHAYMANYLGDDTPRLQGRLTLNPLAHLDPWGTLLIFLVGIGWGKPVQFNPFNLKNLRRDTMLVALAGPMSNILLAVVIAVIAGFLPSTLLFQLKTIIHYFILLNLALAIFNLIPIDPLDGYKVVAGLLPPHLAYRWESTKQYGLIILVVILLTGVAGSVVFGAANYMFNLLITFTGI